jgi:hypothetical protein
MPTTRPRYSITDTGSTRALLNDAEREWPDVEDRKELLLRLARAGHEALRLDRAEVAARERSELQRSALKRLRVLVDVDTLLTDQAWR